MAVYDKIFECLLLRKAYHLLGGALLLIGLRTLDAPSFLMLGVIYWIAFWVFGKRVSFAVLGILMLLAVSGSKVTTMGATIVFWIGDGFAALVGSKFGRTSWPWNERKTIVGSLAFFSSSALALFVFLTSIVQSVPSHLYFLVPVTALAGTVAEILPLTLIKDRKPDDNLVIILVSGILLQSLASFFGLPLPTN